MAQSSTTGGENTGGAEEERRIFRGELPGQVDAFREIFRSRLPLPTTTTGRWFYRELLRRRATMRSPGKGARHGAPVCETEQFRETLASLVRKAHRLHCRAKVVVPLQFNVSSGSLNSAGRAHGSFSCSRLRHSVSFNEARPSAICPPGRAGQTGRPVRAKMQNRALDGNSLEGYRSCGIEPAAQLMR